MYVPQLYKILSSIKIGLEGIFDSCLKSLSVSVYFCIFPFFLSSFFFHLSYIFFLFFNLWLSFCLSLPVPPHPFPIVSLYKRLKVSPWTGLHLFLAHNHLSGLFFFLASFFSFPFRLLETSTPTGWALWRFWTMIISSVQRMRLTFSCARKTGTGGLCSWHVNEVSDTSRTLHHSLGAPTTSGPRRRGLLLHIPSERF